MSEPSGTACDCVGAAGARTEGKKCVAIPGTDWSAPIGIPASLLAFQWNLAASANLLHLRKLTKFGGAGRARPMPLGLGIG